MGAQGTRGQKIGPKRAGAAQFFVPRVPQGRVVGHGRDPFSERDIMIFYVGASNDVFWVFEARWPQAARARLSRAEGPTLVRRRPATRPQAARAERPT